MALQANSLRSTAAGAGSEIRMVVKRNKVGTLAAVSGAPLLPKGTPLAWNSSSSFWVPYTQPSDAAQYTITTAAATQTDGGTFLLIIDGLATEIPWDATAAELEALVNATLLDAGKPWVISTEATSGTDLGGDTVVTIDLPEAAGAPSVQLDSSGILDGAVPEPANYVLAAVDAGTQLNDTAQIRGFLQDVGGRQTSASEEVQIVVMLEGEVHRDDINTSAIRAVLPGAPSEGELDTALKSQKLRELSLHVRGLAGVS